MIKSLWVILFFISCSRGQWAFKEEKKHKIKNVIFMIGDGMGPQQLALLYHYARNAPHSTYKNKKTIFEILAKNGMGMHIPHPYGEMVIDSAASATHMASGKITRPGILGLDKDGGVVESILEQAKKAQLATGLVSDTRLTHATPAAYASHIMSRQWEDKIALQMLSVAPDIMLAGGLKFFIPKDAAHRKSHFYKNFRNKIPQSISLKSARMDRLNLLSLAEKKGYELSFDLSSLKALTATSTSRSRQRKILGLFASDALPGGIWYTKHNKNPHRKIPNLTEMSRQALRVLAQNKKGFFLMIEGGQIDWAGHVNDPGSMLHNMIHFEKTVASVVDWAKKRDDTLVVITGDHETGNFGFSYSKRAKEKILKLKKSNIPYITYSNYGNFELLDKLYGQQETYYNMAKKFYGLPKKRQTSENFKNLFNQNSLFKITEKEASLIGKNQYIAPDIHDFKHFYKTPDAARGGVLARILAEKQKIVWGTGSHTSTPIPVFTFGPRWITQKFHGLYNNTHIKEILDEALGLKGGPSTGEK